MKKETTNDRIERLEYSLAKAHLDIKRIQDHVRCLECDKTTLIAEIQRLKNPPVFIWSQWESGPITCTNQEPFISAFTTI